MTQYIYENVEVVRVVDGDTVILKLTKDFKMEVDFGFHIKDELSLQKSSIQTFRLLGINTPEVVGETKASGLLSKVELQRLLSLGSLKVASEKSDAFGRWLATIFVRLPTGEEININEELLKTGFAVPYVK